MQGGILNNILMPRMLGLNAWNWGAKTGWCFVPKLMFSPDDYFRVLLGRRLLSPLRVDVFPSSGAQGTHIRRA